MCCGLKFPLVPTDRTPFKTTLFRRKDPMIQLRNITMIIALAFALVWMSGCGGCNPEPLPSGMSPTEGPETGGTTVRISGEKFDMKNGVTITFGDKGAQSVTVPSKTEIRDLLEKLLPCAACRTDGRCPFSPPSSAPSRNRAPPRQLRTSLVLSSMTLTAVVFSSGVAYLRP